MNIKPRKVPMRMCVGCRQMFEKKNLVRIVRDANGNAFVDMRGKASGRGAYICKNSECLEKALRSRAIERAIEVTLDDGTKMRLAEEMQ